MEKRKKKTRKKHYKAQLKVQLKLEFYSKTNFTYIPTILLMTIKNTLHNNISDHFTSFSCRKVIFSICSIYCQVKHRVSKVPGYKFVTIYFPLNFWKALFHPTDKNWWNFYHEFLVLSRRNFFSDFQCLIYYGDINFNLK